MPVTPQSVRIVLERGTAQGRSAWDAGRARHPLVGALLGLLLLLLALPIAALILAVLAVLVVAGLLFACVRWTMNAIRAAFGRAREPRRSNVRVISPRER